MRKRFASWIGIALLCVCASACGGNPVGAADAQPTVSPAIADTDALPSARPRTPAPETPAQETPVPEPADSLTTGRLLTTGRRHSPVLVVIANEPQVRPQMGLMQADILYEFALDRGAQTTRLVALFSDEYPALAGPVSEARIYFFDLRREYNAMMAYWGYPDEAGYPAFDESVIDIPAAYGPDLRYLFKRDTTVSSVPEQTLFCRVDELAAALYGTMGPGNAERFTFASGAQNPNGKAFTRVGLPFNGKDTTGIEFVYDETDNLLYRYERNSKGTLVQSKTLTASADGMRLTSEPVRVQNLIVQHIKYTPFSERYYNAELVGKGECDFFINGQYCQGHWRRDAIDGTTSYFLRDGNPLTLEPGTTWIAFNGVQRAIKVYYPKAK